VTREVRRWEYREGAVRLERGQELGRFDRGSTVIVLFGKDAVRRRPELVPGRRVGMGETVGEAPAG
jgi:phosphatidylserine decarboxylase